MKEKNMTALMSCFSRAYHSKNYKFKIFNDYLAQQLLSNDEYQNISDSLINGINFFNPSFIGNEEEKLRYVVDNFLSPTVLGRSAYAEEMLNNALRLGINQYLMLAAGYDTSAYYNNSIKAFELDKKSIIKDKKRRLKEANIDYSNVTYIEADFINNVWIDKLLQSNYEKDKRAFVSLLGISYYLNKLEFMNLLKNLADILAPGSEIVFDYPTDNEDNSDVLIKELADGAGEKMKSKYNIGDLELELQNNDLLVYENLNSAAINKKYFDNYNTLNPNNKINVSKGVNFCLLVKKSY